MKRMILALAIAAAVIGAFMLGRFSAQPTHQPIGTESSSQALLAADPATNDGVPTDPDTAGVGAGTEPARRPLSPAGPPGPGSTVRGDDATGTGSGVGPSPLSQYNEQRARAVAEKQVLREEPIGELYELARDEPPDADSARLEELIAATIRQHGGSYTALQLSRPQCTRTVCMLMAAGDMKTDDPRSNWQRLASVIANQPWFREHFDDVRTMVTGDADGAIYLTFFVRCAPGRCRPDRR